MSEALTQSEDTPMFDEDEPHSDNIQNENDDIMSEPSMPQATTSSASWKPSMSECAEVGIPHLITQSEFFDMVREAKMTQESIELVASRLKQWNLVAADFRVNAIRKRTSEQVNKAKLDT